MNQAAVYRPVKTQKVAVGTASAASAAVGNHITMLRLVSDTDCFVTIGTGIAAATDMPLFAKQPEYFVCSGGDTVAVIQSAAAGNLYVTELTR